MIIDLASRRQGRALSEAAQLAEDVLVAALQMGGLPPAQACREVGLMVAALLAVLAEHAAKQHPFLVLRVLESLMGNAASVLAELAEDYQGCPDLEQRACGVALRLAAHELHRCSRRFAIVARSCER